MADKTHHWHNLAVSEVIKILQTSLAKGLKDETVEAHQKKFGRNELPQEKPLSRSKIFLEQFKSPLIYILLIAGLLTLLLKVWSDAIVIFLAVFLNTAIGFFQEYKASNALRALRKAVRYQAEVLREDNLKIIESEEVVRGDVFLLKPGDRVPADGRLVESENLRVNEMALTGEWLAAKKHSQKMSQETPMPDRDNMVYMGTTVEAGRAKVVAVATGSATEMGKVAQMLREGKEGKTPLQKRLTHFSQIIAGVIVFICLLIFIEGALTGNSFLEMFTLSVAIAVAAIPEGLPIAVTVILALGMQRILKRKGLVRKLLAAETLGSTSVIATDKTATLTEGIMKVSQILSPEQIFEGAGEDAKQEGFKISALKIAALANEAFIENPDEPLKNWVVRGRPTDRALLVAGIEAGIDRTKIEKQMEKVDELPFSSSRKYLASLYHYSDNGYFFYVSGAPEKIIGICKKLTKHREKKFKQSLDGLTRQGFRVVAVAYKKIKNPRRAIRKSNNLEDECQGLIFAGLIGLKDPLRKEVKEAVKVARAAGLKTIIVTGDHKLTARAVAEEIGFKIKEQNIIEGRELDKLTDEQFQEKINSIKIFARVEPRHKLRIVEAWQAKGKVVAMTGDGVNDAPALKLADIGVALGSGTDVAKQTSDLILLTDSFNVILRAIEEGRAILDNIRKTITYLLSGSFSEIILIGVVFLFGWLRGEPLLLPIIAVQILWVNIIEDGPMGLALAFEPKENDLMQQPVADHKAPLLTAEMKVLIFIIGIITDLLLLGLFFWLLRYSAYPINHIRSIMFAGLTIDSIFYIFSCKSLRKNIWHINIFSNRFMVVAWVFGVIMLLGALYLPPFQTLLRTTALNLFDWGLVLFIGVSNMLLIEGTKWCFISRKQTA